MLERPNRSDRDRLRLFERTIAAYFLTRPNRFLVRCRSGGRTIHAFLPNPGRLQELLLPGRRLYLVREDGLQQRKTRYTVVGVERDSQPVMLHTHLTNAVAHYLLTHREVPGLEGAIVRASEVKVGRNRFDFLLEQGKKRILLEVKSCTLFGRHVAMFPDAVTERGARHLRELASRAEGNTDGAVLFVVHWPHARIFMPNYHTDLCFAETLLAVRHQIRIIALSVRWGPDLSLEGEPRLLDIPWDYIERESKDRGSYLLVLFLKRNRSVSVGKLGKVLFARGFYVYVGSAMGGLKRRIERHRRLRKHLYWHIDALRAVAEFRYALPVRSSVRLECDIASALESLGDWQIPGFGSTDCTCRTHLFGFTSDPVDYPGFHNLLQHFRMDRYVSTS